MSATNMNMDHYELILKGKEAVDRFKKANPDTILSLKEADFLNAKLSEFNLQKANLLGANFQLADLQGVDLQGANLLGADLLGANLKDANLQGANLRGANLQEADLTGANLTGANLLVANMMESVLENAIVVKGNLKGANLQRAQLQNADFTQANLDETNLLIANMQNAVFKEATLRKAKLQGTNLQNADMEDSDLTGADLERSDLQEANLNNSILNSVNFSSANLMIAKLQEAQISKSDFTRAVLKNTDFQMSDLSLANMLSADMVNANLQGVDFTKSNLKGVDLTGANLQLCDFTKANLQEAVLTDAKINKATFEKANLQSTVFNSKKVLKKLKIPLTEIQKNQILLNDEIEFRKKKNSGIMPGRIKISFTGNPLWTPKELSRIMDVFHNVYSATYFLINSPLEINDDMHDKVNSDIFHLVPWKQMFVEKINTSPFEIYLGTIDFPDPDQGQGLKKPSEVIKIMGTYLSEVFKGKENIMNLYDIELSNENVFHINAENLPIEISAEVLKKISDRHKICDQFSFDNPEVEKNKKDLFTYSMAPTVQYSDWAYKNGFGFMKVEYLDET